MRFALRTCALALASALTAAGAATSSVVAPAVKVEPGLRAYEGRYTYQDEGSIVLVADGPRLVAVLGEAKYPLRQRSADVFTNTAGTDIPFIRDAQGRIIGFQESGQTYRKLADNVPQAVREVKIYETDHWVRAFWGLPSITDPGGKAAYCSAGILAAGRAVEQAAGMPLPAYAHQQLFAPMGISRSAWRWNFELNRSQRGEFAQILMRPRDMLKLGLLVAGIGRWQGQQLVAADWVGRMTAKQSVVDGSAHGFGIWHRFYNVKNGARSTRVETLMMSGNGGQKIYIVPSLDFVAVFTGGNYNEEAAANRIMADHLLPALLRDLNAGRERLN